MNRRIPISIRLSMTRVLLAGATLLAVGLFANEIFARVGGGQSYGGGGHGGGGGGGALVYLIVRFLLWLTIEYPYIGIPVDIIVIGLVVYWFAKPSKKSVSISSTSITAAPDPVSTAVQQQNFTKTFNQLRRFDPNFSEIIFID